MATATRRRSQRAKTAEHRPAKRKRNFKHDDVTAVDMFSGFGGLTRGMQMAGVTTIMAANHNRYKVEVHEANHPDAEHWVCDLVDIEAGDYHSPRDLPKADIFAAGVSCKNHSGANAQRAYASGDSIFDSVDPEWEARVTKSERDRATALCVLQYAGFHHPKVILVECTTELTSWGFALPNKPTIGDGTTFRWWMHEFEKLGYRSRTLYLNSMFFGVPQSRDRIYICFWDKTLRDPDLEFRPVAWCEKCESITQGVWTWRTGIPPSGRVRWGSQYDYRCERCQDVVIPPRAPAIMALDLTDLGTKIGDRTKPLAVSSMERIRRCIERFKEFPAVLMPAKSLRGVDRHPWMPMGTQTSQQETALISTGGLVVGAGQTYEREGSVCRSRPLSDPTWTQHATGAHGIVMAPTAAVIPYRNGTLPALAHEPMPTQGSLESMALLSAGVLPYRRHTIPSTHAEPMPTFTSDQIPAVLAAGVINANGNAGEAQYRAHPVDDPFTSFTANPTHQLLSAAFFKQNGGANDTAQHPLSDPLGTLTSVDTTGLAVADWYQMLDGLEPDDCYYRMMFPREVRDGCGFDAGFIVWGSARDQIDGYGNAVSPRIGMEIALRLKEIL